MSSGMISSDNHLRKNRNIYDIVAILLNLCLQETSKVQVLYKSKLNTQGFTAYINLLERRKLIEYVDGKYSVTEKGREYLQNYNAIMAILNEPQG